MGHYYRPQFGKQQEIKLIVTDSEMQALPHLVPKVIDIMEHEQAYAANMELLPFVSDMSKDNTLIISQHAAEFYPCHSQ